MFTRHGTTTNVRGTTIPLTHEHFTSPMELVDTIMARKTVNLGGKYSHIKHGFNDDPDFFGDWHTSAKLRSNLTDGGRVPEMESDLIRFADNLVYEVERKIERKMDVCGQRIHMGRFISGNPRCMVRNKAVHQPNKSIHIVVDTTIWCGISIRKYQNTGKVLMMALLKLKAKGYDVAFTSASSVYVGNQIALMSTSIIRPNETFNASRVCIPFEDTSYNRAGLFAWMDGAPFPKKTTSHTTPYVSENFYKSHQAVKDFLAQQFDGNVVVLTMDELTTEGHDASSIARMIVNDIEGGSQ